MCGNLCLENSVSVINYTNLDVPRQTQDECSSIENLTSPEDFNCTDDSMIRNMLNPTPNPKNQSLGFGDEEETRRSPLYNNNDISCNHNTNIPRNTIDTAKDILEDVQRYFILSSLFSLQLLINFNYFIFLL